MVTIQNIIFGKIILKKLQFRTFLLPYERTLKGADWLSGLGPVVLGALL